MTVRFHWIKTRDASLSLRAGRNKLSRYPGYQIGIHINGGPRHDYFLWQLVLTYWTVTLAGSWALTEAEYSRRKRARAEPSPRDDGSARAQGGTR